MPDEAAPQVKGLSYLWDPEIVGLRGSSPPEGAHPRWNALNRRLDQHGLRGAVLKGTTIANWRKGPYMSGANEISGQDALAMRLRDYADLDWLEKRADSIAFDKMRPVSETESEMLEDWREYMESTGAEFVIDFIVLQIAGPSLFKLH